MRTPMGIITIVFRLEKAQAMGSRLSESRMCRVPGLVVAVTPLSSDRRFFLSGS